MQWHSIRFKASVYYTVLLCCILLAYNAILFFSVRFLLYNNLDEKLRIKAEEIATALNTYVHISEHQNHSLAVAARNIVFVDAGKQRVGSKQDAGSSWLDTLYDLNVSQDYITFLNARQESIVSSSDFNANVRSFHLQKAPFSLDKIIIHTSENNGERLRVINYPFSYKDEYHHVLQIGTTLDSIELVLVRLVWYMAAGMVVILFLTSFVGGVFAQRILKPVMAVTESANAISHKDLHVRIKNEAADQEMNFLIVSFNEMIARLESSFRHISEFSSHVAHELKTPLAIIRGEIELALSKNRDVDEYKRVLHISLEEVKRLVFVVQDLLLLAKLDYQAAVISFAKIDIVDFMHAEIFEPTKMLAAEKNIVMHFEATEQKIYIEGDMLHLRRLFFNLINNAIKFTAQDGVIRLIVQVINDAVHIAVRDSGCGIAPSDCEKVFQKFYRVQQTDTHCEQGSGLGLNIALSIAKAHGGTIMLESVLGKGTTFTTVIPMMCNGVAHDGD